jgi:DNA-binding PadR family transcriptional regulator
MQNNWLNVDLKNMVDALRENIRAFGGFSPEQVRQSGLLNENDLRRGIIKALASGPKTGAGIIEEISAAGTSNFKPAASAIYPLFESLADEGLIGSTFKKDRKFYSLTEAGKEFLAGLAQEPEVVATTTSENWAGPKWVDLRGTVPIAISRLGKVSIEVAKYGSKDQQDEAAKAIDEARRRIHEILASE